MEVLNGGMTTKFLLPVEDEPDIDRFIDEDIMVDMDTFTLHGLLRKVSTCKKKNKETKEFEYYKELTIEVTGIINSTDPTQNIRIPGKKNEYTYHVEFRYVPDEEETEEIPVVIDDNGNVDPIEPDLDKEMEEIESNDGNPAPDESDGLESKDPDPEPELSETTVTKNCQLPDDADDFFADDITSDADPAAEKKPDEDGIDWN